MANVKVGLFRLVKASKGWVYRRVNEKPTRKGRGWTVDWGEPTVYGSDCIEVGPFQLKWYVGGTLKYTSVGYDLREAVNAQERKELQLEADASAKKAGRPVVEVPAGTKPLTLLRDEFIKEKKDAGRDSETISMYENLIARFFEVSSATFPSEITQTDLLAFRASIKKRGFSERLNYRGMRDRSVQNCYGSLCTFLIFCGVDHKARLKPEYRKKVKDPLPTAYTVVEISRFMSGLKDERHKLFFQTLLRTGLRERELTHLEWSDIDFANSTLTVQGEKIIKLGQTTIIFHSKTRTTREIALDAILLGWLQDWKDKSPGTIFVFGTKKWRNSPGDRPDGHMLELVKQVATETKLNCGVCNQCRDSKGKSCSRWKLHKFRSSFATWALQGGVDLRTVSAHLGHQRLEVTDRYLKAAEKADTGIKLGVIFSAI